jgi:site-specific recombinase XerD
MPTATAGRAGTGGTGAPGRGQRRHGPPERDRGHRPPPTHGSAHGAAHARPTRRKRPARRLPPEVLSNEEVCALLAACGTSPTGVRHRALLALLYRSGLRLNEALQVRPKDLDLSNGAVRVLFGKGGTWRTVGVDAGATVLIEEWLAARSAWGMDARAPLFCTANGRCIAQGFLRRLLPELARKAGIERRVHAHGLRHTHAAQLRAEGVDIGIISKQLGHACITTTARYLDHIAPQAVVEAVRGRRWR